MAISEYFEGETVRVGYSSKGHYTRLLFKQYYEKTKEVSWQAFSYPSLDFLKKMLTDNEKQSIHLPAGSVQMTRAQLNIHTACNHLLNESVDNMLQGFRPKAFTITVSQGDRSSREFMVSDLNTDALLEVLHELHPELLHDSIKKHDKHLQDDLSP